MFYLEAHGTSSLLEIGLVWSPSWPHIGYPNSKLGFGPSYKWLLLPTSVQVYSRAAANMIVEPGVLELQRQLALQVTLHHASICGHLSAR